MQKVKQLLKIVFMPFLCDKVGTLLITVLKILYGIVPLLRISLMAAFIENVSLYIAGSTEFKPLYAILFFIVILYEQSFSVIENLASVKLKNSIWNTYSLRTIKKWSSVKYEYTENEDIYAQFMRVKDKIDTQVYNNFSSLITLVAISINIITLLIYFFNTQLVAGFILTGLFVILVIVSISGGKIQYKASVEAQKSRIQRNYFEDVLTSKHSVKERSVFGFNRQIENYLQKYFKRFVKAQMSAYRKFMAGFEGVHIGITLVSVVMIYFFTVMLVNGNLTVGIYVALVTNVVTLVRSFTTSIDVNLRAVVKAFNFVKDYDDLMSLDETEFVSEIPVFKKIEFIDVKFKYANSESYILDGINLCIESGKSYALIGANGAGKTTIIKILTGLYRNYEGHIYVDGKELNQNPKYYNLFVTLFQDFAHYNIKLRDYLTMGENSSSITDNFISNKLQSFSLGYLLDRLPRGFDTVLGKNLENGIELSGGEWQKLALVRSVCVNREVKIYDEPTAALDPIAESEVYQTVFGNKTNETMLVVSHRLGLTKLVDEVIVLYEGKILEKGSKDFLLNQKGLFYQMYNEQKEWYKND